MAEERARRQAHQQRAYELQLRGGAEGAARWTVYGLIAVTVGHLTWPLFKRQTWALKGFLVSSSSIFGLVIGADEYLLRYESGLRAAENDIRRQARNALARQGRIATESEIRRWRQDQEAEAEATAKAETAKAEIEAVTSISKAGGEGVGMPTPAPIPANVGEELSAGTVPGHSGSRTEAKDPRGH